MSGRRRQATATISDVARKAGVSVTTVSRVFNGKGQVTDLTRDRVLSAALDLGYPARTPRAKSVGSGLLAMTICAVTGSPPASFGVFQFYNEILNGAAASAIEAGYSLVMVPDGSDVEGMLERIEPQGAIAVDPGPGQPLVAYARESRMPLVTTGRASDGEDYWVDNDYVATTRLAVEHLERCNAGRIALISPPTDRSYSADSIASYRQWCAERGQEEVIAITDGLGQEEAKSAAAELILSANPPGGIFTLLDSLAVGALEAAQEIGVSVPKELKLLAMTDSPFCAKADPPISVLDLNPYRLGTEAVRSLVSIVEHREVGPPSAAVPVELIVRDTCGARLIRRSDPIDMGIGATLEFGPRSSP